MTLAAFTTYCFIWLTNLVRYIEQLWTEEFMLMTPYWLLPQDTKNRTTSRSSDSIIIMYMLKFSRSNRNYVILTPRDSVVEGEALQRQGWSNELTNSERLIKLVPGPVQAGHTFRCNGHGTKDVSIIN